MGKIAKPWKSKARALICTVPISDIKVTKVKNEIDSLFSKHDYELERIAKDNEIRDHDEFKSQGTIIDESLIAIKKGNKFEIRDGIHRAVRLALDGGKDFELVFYYMNP